MSHVVIDEKSCKLKELFTVAEQRASHAGQGLLFLTTVAAPFLTALAQIPRGILAGMFFVMRLQTLLFQQGCCQYPVSCHFSRRDIAFSPTQMMPPQGGVPICCNAARNPPRALFGVTQTAAAIGFPILIIMIIPVKIGGCRNC